MTTMLQLIITLSVLAVWHMINIVLFVSVVTSKVAISSDRRIAAYLTFVGFATVGVIGWTVYELWKLL